MKLGSCADMISGQKDIYLLNEVVEIAWEDVYSTTSLKT
jgi:hypothetical protein